MLVFVGFFICWIGWVRLKNNNFKLLNLVFDLDNTLIMSLEKKRYEHIKIAHKPDIILANRVVWVRPWVRSVLYLLDKFCFLYLFTKAEKTYADMILEQAGIGQYFVSRKYKTDCDNIYISEYKDIGQFSSSYTKIIDHNSKLKRLEIFDFTTDKKYSVDKIRLKLQSEIKKHQSKLEKFICRTTLIDDKITNRLPGQNFYHINYYHFGMIWDIEMLKLLGWVGWKSLINMINNL